MEKSCLHLFRDAPCNLDGTANVTFDFDHQRLGPPRGRLQQRTWKTFDRVPIGQIIDDTLTLSLGVNDFATVVIEPARGLRAPQQDARPESAASNREVRFARMIIWRVLPSTIASRSLAGTSVFTRFKKTSIADVPTGKPTTIRYELSLPKSFGYEWDDAR